MPSALAFAAAWSHGKCDHIPGFVSQQEALRWIETKARSWVSEQTRSSFRGVAAFQTGADMAQAEMFHRSHRMRKMLTVLGFIVLFDYAHSR